MFKDVLERNIRECMDMVPGEIDLEKEVKVTTTIDIIKKKTTAVKKLEEEIIDTRRYDSLLEETVNEGINFEIYCKEQLTFSSKYTEKLEKKLHQKYKDKSRDNKLSKLEIKKFSGEPTRGWMTFIDSFEATVDCSTNLSDVEKFNYSLLDLGKYTLRTTSGMPTTNANCKKALELLRNRFGNSQKITSALQITSAREVKITRLFYGDIEGHVKSLDGSGINSHEYGALLAPVIVKIFIILL